MQVWKKNAASTSCKYDSQHGRVHGFILITVVAHVGESYVSYKTASVFAAVLFVKCKVSSVLIPHSS